MITIKPEEFCVDLYLKCTQDINKDININCSKLYKKCLKWSVKDTEIVPVKYCIEVIEKMYLGNKKCEQHHPIYLG
jgi:hypothetical protein